MKKIILKLITIIFIATICGKEIQAISDQELYGIIGGATAFVGIITAITVYKNKDKISQAIQKFRSKAKKDIDKSTLSTTDKNRANEQVESIVGNLQQSTASLPENFSDAEAKRLAEEIPSSPSSSSSLSQSKLSQNVPPLAKSHREMELMIDQQAAEQARLNEDIINLGNNIRGYENLAKLGIDPAYSELVTSMKTRQAEQFKQLDNMKIRHTENLLRASPLEAGKPIIQHEYYNKNLHVPTLPKLEVL